MDKIIKAEHRSKELYFWIKNKNDERIEGTLLYDINKQLY